MALQNSTRFCVFCYRNDNRVINTLAKYNNFYLFLKLLGRFNGDSNNILENQIHSKQLDELSLSHLLGCCEECIVTVNGFCDDYQEYKCLELQLEWKIKKLVNIVKLANKVPSRVSQINKALQIKQTEDDKGLLDQTDNIKLVRSFRHCFAKQCRRRLGKCQPRVILRMKLPKKSSDNDCSRVTDFLKNTSTETSNSKIGDSIVLLSPLNVNYQSSKLCKPETTSKPNEDGACRENVLSYQDYVSENASDDNDSITNHDYDDDPLNFNDFCEGDTQGPNNTVTVQNINNSTNPIIQAKLEIPNISDDNVTQLATASAQPPQSSPSLIIENVFSMLPLPLSEVLSKTSLCKFCKNHFISEDSLNKHIEKDHSKTSPKTQKPLYLKTETVNQDNDTPLIQIYTKKGNMPHKPTPSSQQRYNLREKRSTVKYNDNDDKSDTDNNDMDYTAEMSPSSSILVANDSDSHDIKPNIKIKKSLPKNPQNKVEYTFCEICKKKTTTKFLEAHTKTWHDTTGLDEPQIKRCEKPKCLAYFLNNEQLSFHQRNEHNKIFRCHFCHKKFQGKFLLGRHIKKVHKKSLYNPLKCLEDQPSKQIEFKCKFCTFETNFPTKLAVHETEHALPLSDEPLNFNMRRCPRCPYKYSKRMQRRYVVHHLRNHLKYLTGESSGACEMCSKGKVYVENTKLHFDNHHNTDLLDDPTQIFKCDECPSYYLKSFQLHRHKMRIHPSLSCHDCEKTFKTKFSLNCHRKTQHKEHELDAGLPVPCDWPNCVKRFGTEAELEHHKIYSHKRNPEEKKGSEICEICGKGYSSPGRLKFHMEKAHVEKTWVCNECGKTFLRKTNFETHMEYHKGPESWKFECTECGKKCVDKWKLKDHMNTHTKEKPWICQFCGEKYAHRHNWRNHLKGKHMNEEGVEEIVNSKLSQRKVVNYLSRKGTKKGDCIMSATGK